MSVKVVHYSQVRADAVPDVRGVTIRWVVAREDGAPHFAMRLFEVQPGGASPHHRHWWEHELYIIDGSGVADTEEGQFPLAPGTAVFIPGGVLHQFRNAGEGVLRFLCLVPHPELEDWASSRAAPAGSDS
jgi:quercetin dioxygenase-like cupin family protein